MEDCVSTIGNTTQWHIGQSDDCGVLCSICAVYMGVHMCVCLCVAFVFSSAALPFVATFYYIPVFSIPFPYIPLSCILCYYTIIFSSHFIASDSVFPLHWLSIQIFYILQYSILVYFAHSVVLIYFILYVLFYVLVVLWSDSVLYWCCPGSVPF